MENDYQPIKKTLLFKQKSIPEIIRETEEFLADILVSKDDQVRITISIKEITN